MRILFVLFFVVLLPSRQLLALEVDEKLTLRILKTSKSQKTILINRGIEDGLEEGDHAKFFLSVGVVARGKVVKVSPTRSVWSLYRLVNADYVKKDVVMNLKISTPLEVSNDQTKALVEDDQPRSTLSGQDPVKFGIPLAQGAQDLPEGMSVEDQQEILAMQGKMESRDLFHQNFEFYSLAYVNLLGASVSNNDNDLATSGTHGGYEIRFGGEYYFEKGQWNDQLSAYGFASMISHSAVSFDGNGIVSSGFEFGGGVNWHPLGRADSSLEFHPFIGIGFFMGSVTDSFTNAAGIETQGSGPTSGFILSGGLKYFLNNGIGFRGQIEYFTRTENLDDQDNTDITWTRSNSGTKLLLGLCYRW